MPVNWKKIDTIFRRANKRYPNIPTIDKSNESHTAALLQIRESLDIAQRRSGDIRDSFVRVGELEDLGIFDAQYTGKNLGTGAGQVYKLTDEQAGTLKAHQFRTLAAGDGITITQNGTTITINSTSNNPTKRADTTLVTSGAPECDPHSLSFVPSTLVPLAAVGDLAVWVVMAGVGSGVPAGTATLTLPTGWSVLKGNYGNVTGTLVLYKFLTLADLSATHTITEYSTYIDRMCSRVYVYRDVNTELPFGWVGYVHHGMSALWGGPIAQNIPVIADGQHVLQVWLELDDETALPQVPWPYTNSLADSWPLGWDRYASVTEDRVGPIRHNSMSWATSRWHVSTYKADFTLADNMLLREDMFTRLDSRVWTPVNVTTAAVGTGDTSFHTSVNPIGTAANTPRYIEATVELVAGQDYTFAAWLVSPVLATSQAGIFFSVFDPHGGERGFGLNYQPTSANGYVFTETRDTNGDLETNWHYQLITGPTGGSPSIGGGIPTIWLRCVESGTYKFRIYQSVSGTHDGKLAATTSGKYFYCHHTQVRNGFVNPYPVYTDGSGPVTPNQSIYTPGLGWAKLIGNGIHRYFLGITINPSWATLPLAMIEKGNEFAGGTGISYTNSNGSIRLVNPDILYNTSESAYRATRPIYPVKGGAAGKYYFESTIVRIGGSVMSVGVAMSGGDSGAFTGTGSAQTEGYVWRGTQIKNLAGSPLNTPGAFVAGDIIGVAVDFNAKTTTFYKNGTLVYAATMVDTFPGTGVAGTEYDADVPFFAVFSCSAAATPSASTAGEQLVRLKAPFAYTIPAGHVEYDWAGDVNVTTYQSATPNAGTGSQIFYVDQNGIQTARSLVAGTGMTLTSSQTEIVFDATAWTASNVGTGKEVFKTSSGFNLQFRTILGGTGIAVSQEANTITIVSLAARYIGDLLDVTSDYPNVGDALTWNGSAWHPATGGNLDSLSDVTITTPSSGQALMWNGAQWVNQAPPAGGGGGGSGASYLNDLLDVYSPYPNPGDVLTWDGYEWTDGAVAHNLDDLNDVNTPSPTANLPLVRTGTEWKSGNVTKVETILAAASPYAWTKDPAAKYIEVWLVAAGGGGGGGYLGAVSTNRGSGSGGGSAGISHWKFRAQDVPDSLTITVPAGGTAGTAKSGAAGAGGIGGNGGNCTFGALLTATGGVQGKAGAASTTAVTGGAGGTGTHAQGAIGGSGDADAVGTVGGSSTLGPGAGGGGAGSGTTNQVLAAKDGGVSGTLLQNLAGGVGPATTSNTNGTNGPPGAEAVYTAGGSGGAGGGCGHSTTALDRTGGNGGDGGFPGGGGGGGGSSTTNGAGVSGAGGTGGAGVAVVITHY